MKTNGRPKEFGKIQEFLDDLVFKKKTGENDWPADVYSVFSELNQMYQDALMQQKEESRLIADSLEEKIEVRDQRIDKLVQEITDRKGIIQLDSHREQIPEEDPVENEKSAKIDRLLSHNEEVLGKMDRILQDSDAIVQQAEVRAKSIVEKAELNAVQIEKEGKERLNQQQQRVNQILKALASLRLKSNEDMKLILDDLGNLVQQIDEIQEKVVQQDQENSDTDSE